VRLHHVIESQQFDRIWLEGELFPLAQEMEKVAEEGTSDLLEGKRMVSFFYQRSVRTRAAFEIAIKMLGGDVVFSTENASEFSGGIEGEILEDTIRFLCRFHPHVIVLRYHEEGGAKRAAEFSSVPIINAGDGRGQHPTRALVDLYTIQKKVGRIDGISVAMVGDLAQGRTARSLAYLLGKFSGVRIYFITPDTMRMGDDIKDYLARHNIWFTEENNLKAVASIVEVVYQTRTRAGLSGTIVDRFRQGTGAYTVDKGVLDLMKENAIVMHPLPRGAEIDFVVDNDPRAVYLREQADSSLIISMALLKMILA
jgi:aspartate carbamoyltransferase catalytic subunit